VSGTVHDRDQLPQGSCKHGWIKPAAGRVSEVSSLPSSRARRQVGKGACIPLFGFHCTACLQPGGMPCSKPKTSYELSSMACTRMQKAMI
jgi:hypothetical protein